MQSIFYLIVMIIAILIYFRINRKKKPKVDYSFGYQGAKDVLEAVRNENFLEAEALLQKMKPDEFTTTLDYVALNSEDLLFEKWVENSEHNDDGDLDLPELASGVHYLHLAWIARSHAFGKNVSKSKADKFFDLQEIALQSFSFLESDSPYVQELHTRGIRLYMGLSDPEMVETSFQKAIAIKADTVWPYIHYCEAIQPKWGGEKEFVQTWVKSLPEGTLHQQLVMLKMYHEALVYEMDVFDISRKEIETEALTFIQKTLPAVQKSSNLNRFMGFGFMADILEELGDKKNLGLVRELLGSYRPLYPYGIQV